MDEFDKEVNEGKKIMIVILTVYLALIGFAVWVIVKVLQHFKVIWMYNIIEHGVPIGFFNQRNHRDDAFQEHFLDNNRMGFKKDEV